MHSNNDREIGAADPSWWLRIFKPTCTTPTEWTWIGITISLLVLTFFHLRLQQIAMREGEFRAHLEQNHLHVTRQRWPCCRYRSDTSANTSCDDTNIDTRRSSRYYDSFLVIQIAWFVAALVGPNLERIDRFYVESSSTKQHNIVVARILIYIGAKTAWPAL